MTEHEPIGDSMRALEGSPRWVFGQMIKYFRVKAGLTQDQLGELMHISGKTIAAYERAWRVPPWDTTVLLDAVPALATNGALCELWRLFEGSMNYHTYRGGFRDWWERLTLANQIRWYEQYLIPGILQTEDYARAMFRTQFGAPEERVEELVVRRLSRQEFLHQEHPPALWVILEEAVLHRPVSRPRVMFEQIKRLIDATSQTNVRIEVIGSTAGGHRGLSGGGFQILDFEDEPSLGCQEGTIRRQEVLDPKDLKEMEFTWDSLTHETESRANSLALMEAAAKSWNSAA